MAAAMPECGRVKRSTSPEKPDGTSKKPKMSFVHDSRSQLHQAIQTYSTNPSTLNILLTRGVELCCGDGMNCLFTAVVKYENKRKIYEWNDVIERLLRYDPSGVLARGPDNETLFMLFPEKYEYFSKLGADPHATSKIGNVLLYAVIKKCPIAVIEALLKLNIVVNSSTHGMNCFFTAVVKYENGRKSYEWNDVIDTLLRYEPSGVNSRGPDDETLFMLFPEKYEYFLKLGADPHATSKRGNVLLHAVKKNRSYAVIEALLNLNIVVNSFDEEGKTTLMYAASRPNIAMRLIEKGANIHAEDRNGKSVFMEVSATQPILDDAMVKYFIKNGVNFNHQDNNGKSALLAACLQNQFQKVRTLIFCCKANPSIPNKNGTTPLHSVASNLKHYTQIFKFLIKIGARLNCQDSNGYTPLMYAVFSRCHASNNTSSKDIESLLTAGANINIVNNQGQSALMLACNILDKACIELFLKFGASTSITDCDGKTPLLHVTSSSFSRSCLLDCIKLLLEHGCNIFDCDKLGRNVFYNVLKTPSSEAVVNYVYQYAAEKFQERAIVFPKHFQDPLCLLIKNGLEIKTFYSFRPIELESFKFSQPLYKLILSSPVVNPLLLFKNNLEKQPLHCEQLFISKYNFNFIGLYVQYLINELNQLELLQQDVNFLDQLSQCLNDFQNYGFQMTSAYPTVISPLTVLMILFTVRADHNYQQYLLIAQDLIARGAQTYQRLFCIRDRRMRTLSEELQLPDALWAATVTGNKLKCVRLLLDYWPGHPLTLLLFAPPTLYWTGEDYFVEQLFKMLFDVGGPLPPGSKYIRQVDAFISRNVPGAYYEKQQNMLKDFRHSLTVVPKLQSLCRSVIRSCIPHGGNDLPGRFASLPLHQHLCQYVAEAVSYVSTRS